MRDLVSMRRLRGSWKVIYELIRKNETMSIREIQSSANMNYNTIRSALVGLTNKEWIERVGRGVYRIKKK